MLSNFNLNTKKFLFYLVTACLLSQSEINPVFSEVKSSKKNINIEYLEKADEEFYILGEGDALKIQILENVEELSAILVNINPQGKIVLPEIGRVYIAGLTVEELEKLLYEKFKTLIVEPNVKVDVIKLKPINISIMGEVKNPGIYTFNTDNELQKELNPRLFNAIQKAGGISPYSDLTRIEVIRENPITNGGGQIKTTLNLLEVLSTGDKSQNIKLNNNDYIFISKGDEKITFKIKEALKSNINSPLINVYISGDIKGPGILQLKRDTDLNTAILRAGGQGVFKGNVTLNRFTSDGGYSNKTFRFNINNKRGSDKNPYLKEGDIIYVGKHRLKLINEIVTEFTRPFIGIYSTYKIFN